MTVHGMNNIKLKKKKKSFGFFFGKENRLRKRLQTQRSQREDGVELV
jgi:hypothetical protein